LSQQFQNSKSSKEAKTIPPPNRHYQRILILMK